MGKWWFSMGFYGGFMRFYGGFMRFYGGDIMGFIASGVMTDSMVANHLSMEVLIGKSLSSMVHFPPRHV